MSRHLLSAYALPDVEDHDDGRRSVACLPDEIWAAILGQVPTTSTSYGNSSALYIEFIAQPRQRPMPKILDLCSWFGPWEPETAVHVWIVSEPDSAGNASGKGKSSGGLADGIGC